MEASGGTEGAAGAQPAAQQQAGAATQQEARTPPPQQTVENPPQNRKHYGWRWLVFALLVIAIGVVIFVLAKAAHDDLVKAAAAGKANDGAKKDAALAAAHKDMRWIGHLGALFLLTLLSGALTLTNGRFKGMLLNADHRLSTSKLQALVWTYALVFALLSLVIAKFAGAPSGFDHLISEGVKEEYLVLLGGPFATAIATRAIVGTKVDNGTVTPAAAPEAPAGGVSQIGETVTDASGNPSIVDFQYLLFNLVSLVYFIGGFFTEAGDGLPEIPDVLVVLTGAAAATYVGNKATLKSAPALINMTPTRGPVGTPVILFGRNLLTPKADGKGYEAVHVRFGGVRAPDVKFDHTPAGDDRLYVTVPPLGDVQLPTTVGVDVLNYRGVPTAALDFEVKAGSGASSATQQPAAPVPDVNPDPGTPDPDTPDPDAAA